jgi:hypothetical protein
MVSVWLRVTTSSVILVSPLANKPANIIQDLTWALATGKVYSIDWSESVGKMDKGKVPSFDGNIFAPIKVNGSTILCIGLKESDSSPNKVVAKLCADKTPEHNLIDVPEFPKSSDSLGCFKPFRPLPSIK